MNDTVQNADLRMKEAIEWQALLAEKPDMVVSQDFQNWAMIAENRRALADVRAIWDVFEQVEESPELDQARRTALLRAGSRHASLVWRRGVLAAASLLLMVVAGGFGLWMAGPERYVTGAGERRIVMLQDGSRVSMDSSTQIEVRYGTERRQLALVQGQALFDVAHDRARPFTVDVNNERITAVGTKFNVEQSDRALVVTLIDGVVSLKAPEKELTLSAGQQLRLEQGRRPTISQADLADVSAWESGRLSFNEVPLDQAVAAVNRYATRPIKLDAALYRLRISGEFVAGDTEAFIDGVTGHFPVLIQSSTDGSLLLKPR